MDDTQPKVVKEPNRAYTLNTFIRNPFDKTIIPEHIVGFTLDRKRAKSLLRKVDKTYQTEKDAPPAKSNFELIITPEQVIAWCSS